MREHRDVHQNRTAADLNQEPRKVVTLRPLIDREVPLPSAAPHSMGDMPVVVQQWLDKPWLCIWQQVLYLFTRIA